MPNQWRVVERLRAAFGGTWRWDRKVNGWVGKDFIVKENKLGGYYYRTDTGDIVTI